MTRADYMNKKVTHREYYASVVKAAGIEFPPDDDLVQRALRNYVDTLNNVPLGAWDMTALNLKPVLAAAFKEHGDAFTLAGGVCAVKEAVRQTIEKLNPKLNP